MKTTEKMTETITVAASESDFGEQDSAPSLDRDKQSHIRWTTERQIREVSRKLARIKREAIRSEAKGDYFKSGDLAYQIQEIIQATADLFTKSQRAKG
jgi:hypothetical protein